MGTYEVVAVLRPDLDEEGVGTALDRISQRIAEHGGTLVTLDRWGKRKLAYPIQKHRDGYYALYVFTLDPGRIAPLRQVLGLNEELLRFAFASHHAKPVPAGATAGGAPASTAQTTAATVPPGTPAAAAQATPASTPPGGASERHTTPSGGTPRV